MKIGYESTVLSRGETIENPSVHLPRKPPRTTKTPKTMFALAVLSAYCYDFT
jgi:hypothetical protein